MYYLNTIFDAIEVEIGYETNLGQIINYGPHHYIEFYGTKDNEYTKAKAESLASTISSIIKDLNYDNLVSIECEKIGTTKYYKVKLTVIYSFDSPNLVVCKSCKAFFDPKNPAQQLCDKDHTYTCPVCGKTYIIPNYLTSEYLLEHSAERVDFNSSNITVAIPNQYYAGTEIIPPVVVKHGSTTLRQNIDYYIEYCENNVEVGEASIMLRGKWKYSGAILTKFYIVAADIRDCRISPIESQEYNEDGNYNPNVNFTIGGYTLVKDIDYRITEITEGKIAVVGIGEKFTGTRIDSFNIVQIEDAVIFVSSIEDQIYTGKAIVPEVTVMYNGVVLILGKDYIVACKNNVNVGVANLTITGTSRKVDWTGTYSTTFNIVKN